ncbi:mitochondrial ribosomal protein subunit L2 [Cyathus striatus]|nr:mitochondrial ribosomal protein subunit L2 [Cyathus striatus]
MLSSLRGSISRTSQSLRPLLSRSYASAAIWDNQKHHEADSAFSRTEAIYKKYKPVSPGIRHLKMPLQPHLYKGRPVRQLTIAKRKKGGRNNQGIITVRHRGGGHKQRIRVLDFMRKDPGLCDVIRIEYDPGRSAHIALLHNQDTTIPEHRRWSYIVATEGMRAGDRVQSFRGGIPVGFIPGFDEKIADEAVKHIDGEIPKGADADSAEVLAIGLLRTMTLKSGNVLPLRLIPTGTVINSISLSSTGPAILVRSAGTYGQVMYHEEDGRFCHVKLQSGEIRRVLRSCCATIGKVSNHLWKTRNLGKAGRRRWLGWRPSVRGVAMNACDHPHGGGRGKSKSNKHPVSIWGWGTKGTRTRKPGPTGPKNSNKMVVRERPRGTEKKGAKTKI